MPNLPFGLCIRVGVTEVCCPRRMMAYHIHMSSPRKIVVSFHPWVFLANQVFPFKCVANLANHKSASSNVLANHKSARVRVCSTSLRPAVFGPRSPHGFLLCLSADVSRLDLVKGKGRTRGIFS